GYPGPEDFASAVALAISDFRSGRAEITLSIPKAWAIITTAELPSVVRENLSEVVAYELDRLTPLSAEEAYYDFRIVKESDGKLTVLLAAARADILNPYLDALGEKGLAVKRITVNLSATGTLCSYMDAGDNWVFVELREDGYDGALFLDRTLAKTFTNGFTISDERAKADMLFSEIESVREAAKTEGGEFPLVLLLRDQSPVLGEIFKTHSPFPLKVLNETDIGLRLPGPQKELSHAAAGGMLESLWPKSKGLNLLDRGRHETVRQPVGVTVVLVLAIVALWALFLITPYQIELKRIGDIDRQIALKRSEVKKVEALKKDIDTLNGEIATIDHFKESKPMTLNLLKELTTILPKTTWLTRVRVTDTTVEIEGYASSATEMLPKLEASKNFRKAEFASPTFRDARMNADRFVIKMEIAGVKKPEEGVKKPEGEAAKHGKK
ncbi:MAG TPA: PilN domain-containing protein, partial [Thermodesulfovibrionales bacterium]|nr:PilN domain-containing protein [Thermodesulfovibrionales bacterium]